MCKAKTCDDCIYEMQEMLHEQRERQRKDGDEPDELNDITDENS